MCVYGQRWWWSTEVKKKKNICKDPSNPKKREREKEKKANDLFGIKYFRAYTTKTTTADFTKSNQKKYKNEQNIEIFFFFFVFTIFNVVVFAVCVFVNILFFSSWNQICTFFFGWRICDVYFGFRIFDFYYRDGYFFWLSMYAFVLYTTSLIYLIFFYIQFCWIYERGL